MALYARFFNTLGILLQRKLIDIEMVDELFGQQIKSTWQKYRPIAEWRRKDYNNPRFRMYWEYLYNEVKQREHPLAVQTA